MAEAVRAVSLRELIVSLLNDSIDNALGPIDDLFLLAGRTAGEHGADNPDLHSVCRVGQVLHDSARKELLAMTSMVEELIAGRRKK
ncbi:hypothetical protein [Desulfocurvibacter africanus]|uniref:hypothetical protein n=1 Tax=Desulfocurvibacter africanus TaxID=873 RepID=UPI00110C679F|nr:hypothetical protein [Desulfocurvibacter africanus]